MYHLTVSKIPMVTLRVLGKQMIKSYNNDGYFEYTYADWWTRVQKAAQLLADLGVKPGDHVGVMAMNSHRFFELYFAIPSYGAIMHTINVSLMPDQLTFCINNAEDRFIFADAMFLPMLEAVKDKIVTEQYVVLANEKPDVDLAPLFGYENMLTENDEEYDFPNLDEQSPAALCYTTGTTGRPKGVNYSHRSTYLQAITLGHTDVYGIAAQDVIMPVSPMFHNYSWGFPYAAAFCGATIIFPHAGFSTPSVTADLIEKNNVTLTNMVPTLLRDLGRYADKNLKDLSSLRMVLCGGGPPDPSLIKLFYEKWGVRVLNAMGDCETQSALGMSGRLKPYMFDLPKEEQFSYQIKQGIPVLGTEIRVANPEGREVAWNDEEIGEVIKKGIIPFEGYYKDPEQSAKVLDEYGWFHTGDLVTVDPEGYCTLRDRGDDLVKSGGEWISTIELENIIMEHNLVTEACAIRVKHQKWDERPLAFVVRSSNELTSEDIAAHICQKLPKWWIPDEIIFVEKIPKTSVGKFNKKILKAEYQDYLMDRT